MHDVTLELLQGAIETLRSRQDDAALHAVRKTCKRIRAALRLMRKCLGPRAYHAENRRVRDAAKPLSALRDALVLRRILMSMSAAPGTVQGHFDADYHRLRRVLERRGSRAIIMQLEATRRRWSGRLATDSEAASAIVGLKKTYKDGRVAFARSRTANDQALHEWRKQAKYLLNEVELLRTVFNAKVKGLHRRADRLAKVLGEDHDLGMLLTKLRRYRAVDPSLPKLIERRRRKLQARALQLGRRLYRRSARRTGTTIAAALAKSS
ncbi:MAG: CHAD domain-containing protein [Terriglobales bacterium]